MKKIIFLEIALLLFIGAGCGTNQQNTTSLPTQSVPTPAPQPTPQPKTVETKKEWVEVSVFGQCDQEPWKGETEFQEFWNDKNISIHDTRSESRGIVCEACSCDSYYKTDVFVDSSDVNKVRQILDEYKQTSS